jgi:hypothetical protein
MFGLTLMADPNFYSPSGMSPIKYFNADAEGPAGEFGFRGFGIMMSAMGLAFLFDKESKGLSALYAIATLLFAPHMISTWANNPVANKPIWALQIPLHLLVVAISAKAAFM